MIKRLSICFLFLFTFLGACDQEKEIPTVDLEQDYQPLAIGNFWIYEVAETIYFGENDSESDRFFYRDRVRTTYLNAENEIVFVIERAKSYDRSNWSLELEYTLMYREETLLRTIQNQPLVPLVFPPVLGTVWNGKIYQAEGDDDFELESADDAVIPGFESIPLVRINQENLDDKITIRDIRYEVYGKGVGLLEKYDEVVTYCSRNDCLGQQLINGGSKTHLTLVQYGTN